MHWSERMVMLCNAKKPERWSLADLARESGVGVKLIYKYAEGSVDRPSSKRRAQLAGALGVSEDYLFYGTENSSPDFLKVVLLTMNEIGTLTRGKIPKDVWDGVSVESVPLRHGQKLSPLAFAVPVEDNACSPNYLAGDIVICEPIETPPAPGKFVVAQVDGVTSGVLRRYQPLSVTDTSSFKLIANDRFFPDITVDADHPGQLIGRVVKLIRDSD